MPLKRIAGLLTLVFLLAGDRALAGQTLLLGTGYVTGVNYAAGSALAKVVNPRGDGVRLSVRSTGGSIDNIDQVLDGRLAFGIARSDLLYAARQGRGPWAGRPQPRLRAVLGLHDEDFTLVAASASGIASLADLAGKRVNAGERGSGDQIRLGTLLERAGLQPGTDVTLVEAPAARAPRLLQEGRIDAYFYTVGHPNLSIFEALSGPRKVRIVPIEAAVSETLVAASPFLNADEIPVAYYREEGLENTLAVPTVAVRTILFSREDLDDAAVYQVVRQVMENLDLFRRQHPVLARLQPEAMGRVPGIPLHPATGRYLRERSLLPPAAPVRTGAGSDDRSVFFGSRRCDEWRY